MLSASTATTPCDDVRVAVSELNGKIITLPHPSADEDVLPELLKLYGVERFLFGRVDFPVEPKRAQTKEQQSPAPTRAAVLHPHRGGQGIRQQLNAFSKMPMQLLASSRSLLGPRVRETVTWMRAKTPLRLLLPLVAAPPSRPAGAPGGFLFAWHPALRQFAVALRGGDTVHICTLQPTGSHVWSDPPLRHRGQAGIRCLEWRPHSTHCLAVGCRAGVALWNLTGHPFAPFYLAAGPAGALVAPESLLAPAAAPGRPRGWQVPQTPAVAGPPRQSPPRPPRLGHPAPPTSPTPMPVARADCGASPGVCLGGTGAPKGDGEAALTPHGGALATAFHRALFAQPPVPVLPRSGESPCPGEAPDPCAGWVAAGPLADPSGTPWRRVYTAAGQPLEAGADPRGGGCPPTGAEAQPGAAAGPGGWWVDFLRPDPLLGFIAPQSIAPRLLPRPALPAGGLLAAEAPQPDEPTSQPGAGGAKGSDPTARVPRAVPLPSCAAPFGCGVAVTPAGAPGAGAAEAVAPEGGVQALEWSPDGSRLLAGGQAHLPLAIWHPSSGRAMPIARLGGPIVLARWSPQGDYLLTCTNTGVFRVWETLTWTCEKWTLPAGYPLVQDACWSPCGHFLTILVNAGPGGDAAPGCPEGDRDPAAPPPTPGPGSAIAAPPASAQGPSLIRLQFPDAPPTIGGRFVNTVDLLAGLGAQARHLSCDPTGQRLAVGYSVPAPLGPGLGSEQQQQQQQQQHRIALYSTRPNATFDLLPIEEAIQGPPGAGGLVSLRFHPGACPRGAILGACWQGGMATFVPLYFRDM
ncbi:putative aladin [Paratrimastix pyriformis]|uniref:Aladin n=1 Tax=Paratrimastix pyriformis TaxID=342808 RepID=A0ABQ8UN41_9EUKA|nr:putative aladin [Paratrimastix pyriformis]